MISILLTYSKNLNCLTFFFYFFSGSTLTDFIDSLLNQSLPIFACNVTLTLTFLCITIDRYNQNKVLETNMQK